MAGSLSVFFRYWRGSGNGWEKKDEDFGEMRGLGGERCVSGTRGEGKVATSDRLMTRQLSLQTSERT